LLSDLKILKIRKYRKKTLASISSVGKGHHPPSSAFESNADRSFVPYTEKPACVCRTNRHNSVVETHTLSKAIKEAKLKNTDKLEDIFRCRKRNETKRKSFRAIRISKLFFGYGSLDKM
jgi:hypothetical protein